MLFVIFVLTISLMHIVYALIPYELRKSAKKHEPTPIDLLISVFGRWAFRGWGVYAIWNTFAADAGIADLSYFQCLGLVGLARILIGSNGSDEASEKTAQSQGSPDG